MGLLSPVRDKSVFRHQPAVEQNAHGKRVSASMRSEFDKHEILSVVEPIVRKLGLRKIVGNGESAIYADQVEFHGLHECFSTLGCDDSIVEQAGAAVKAAPAIEQAFSACHLLWGGL